MPSEPLVITVALPEEELRKKFQDVKSLGLIWPGANYTTPEVCIYSKENPSGKKHPFELEVAEEKINPSSYYGIPVCETWNGAISIEELQDRILEAKELFKKITGLEGKVYVIGGQD